MTISLTEQERKVARALAIVKKKSGSHSPSPAMLKGLGGVKITQDFCYLSNPHATELFLKYFHNEMSGRERLRAAVERYPSQNSSLAGQLELAAGVGAKNIFVGNGATEVIQAVLKNFVKRKVVVPVPSFSPYLEFAPKGVEVVKHTLLKEGGFSLDVETFLAQVKKERPDAVVIVNPNNPDGGYLSFLTLKQLLNSLKNIQTVIVDESFIHFAGEEIQTVSRLPLTYRNVVVVKSLSKDFGIAGLRLGYAVMSEKRVSALLTRGFLWNVSGFGEYFLGLLNRKDFLRRYERSRLLAIKERDIFFRALSKIPKIKVYPSRANFFLVELTDGSRADDLSVRLLVRHGMYIRPCGDKAGLTGEFVRVASRGSKENNELAQALRTIFRGV